jgi:transposase
MPAVPPTLLPNPSLLRLDYLSAADSLITLTLTTKRQEAHCPLCGCPSFRVHSYYVRTLADLPWNGVPVRLRLTIRRFFCDTKTCRRRIFAERLPGVAAPHARRTLRLTEALELIGFALGGEAGARVVKGLSMEVSPDTLLRLIRAAELPEQDMPRVLGVDDFAFRRGRKYGTLLIDLERHARVDMLPDRSAETLAAWLLDHPGVEVLSRDRGGSYADAGRRGAPEAVQVADRFHVLANLREALEHLLIRKHRCLNEAATALMKQEKQEAEQQPPEEALPTATPQTRDQLLAQARRARRLARYEEVQRLQAEGWSLRGIARQMGLARQTVCRFAHAETFPERAPRARYPSITDPYEPYLRQRWNEGCQNAAQLWREIRQQGFAGSCSNLRDRLATWRTRPARYGRPPSGSRSPPAPPTICPRSPRQASWLLVRLPGDVEREDQAYLEQLFQLCPEVATAYSLAQEFGRLVRERDHPALEHWLLTAEQTKVPELVGFVAGMRRDQAAVEQMLLMEWSNGQLEGQVNRLKLLKRAMYGRAKFDLLRRRVLHAS